MNISETMNGKDYLMLESSKLVRESISDVGITKKCCLAIKCTKFIVPVAVIRDVL